MGRKPAPKKAASSQRVEVAEKAATSTKVKKGKLAGEGASEAARTSESTSGINALTNLRTPDDVFQWLLGSVPSDKFFKNNWERQYLHIARKDGEYYTGLFGKEMLKQMAKDNELHFVRDVNACRYVNHAREGMNEEGRFLPKHVDQLFKKKATLQVHQPQRFFDGLHHLVYYLEAYFGCLVGANVYLTPAASQGLAPHHDDVDVFILQLEGTKRWKLYNPKDELARDYSPDLDQDAIGEPILDVTLRQGDLLYFPRGTIHQACVEDVQTSAHSTHLTISCYQRQSWSDIMEHVLPLALDDAIDDDIDFRRGMPRDLHRKLGSGMLTEDAAKDITAHIQALADRLKQYMTGDVLHAAADIYMQDYVKSRLPPPSLGAVDDGGQTIHVPQMSDEVRLKHPEACRLVVTNEEDADGDPYVLLVHCLDNDRAAHMMGAEPSGGCCDDDDCEGHDGAEGSDAEDGSMSDGESSSHGDSEAMDADSHDAQQPGPDSIMTAPGCIRFEDVRFASAIRRLLDAQGAYVALSKLPLPDDEWRSSLASVLELAGLLEYKHHS